MGIVWLRIEPNARGKGFEFASEVSEAKIPRQYVNTVEQALRGTICSGILAGYPVIDVKITLFDGSYHEQNSQIWLSESQQQKPLMTDIGAQIRFCLNRLWKLKSSRPKIIQEMSLQT